MVPVFIYGHGRGLRVDKRIEQTLFDSASSSGSFSSSDDIKETGSFSCGGRFACVDEGDWWGEGDVNNFFREGPISASEVADSRS